jgi:hypothetical protein
MDGGGGRLPVDGNCGRPPADGAAVRLRRTALEDGPGRQRRTSVGSSDASGRVTTLRPTPSAENLLAPWHGDLLHDTSTSLVIVLQKRQMEDGGPELTFQAIYEGLSRDQSWGMDAYPCHPIDRGVGHFRWLYGQLVILPPEDQVRHVADIVQRVLRFLGWPATNQQN